MNETTTADARPDEALVVAFQAGDERAFVAIVDRYKHRLARLALTVVRNQEDALDVVQDAFIKSYRALKKFRGTSALYTWLYRVVMNHAIDHLRSRPRVTIESETDRVYELPDTANAVRPDREALNAELREKIFAAVDSLSEKHRRVVILREIEGMSYKEIAEVTGCTEGTVMSRLFYGREQMRKKLEPYLRSGL